MSDQSAINTALIAGMSEDFLDLQERLMELEQKTRNTSSVDRVAVLNVQRCANALTEKFHRLVEAKF